jgi:hypothetical protein
MKYSLMRIYLSENDRIGGRPAHEVIIEFLRDNTIAGATAFRGMEGYGVHSKIHTSGILRLEIDLPVIIEAVDLTDRLREITPGLREMIPDELVILQEVTVLAGEGR